MPQQFIALLGGGLAVVAGDGEVHVGRHERPLQGVELLSHVMGYVDGVGALALGHRDGDRGVGAPFA